MENGWRCEQKTLICELLQGMEVAKQLRAHLSTSSPETRELLVQRILSSYERSLLILNWSGSMGQQPQNVGPITGVPESPISINGSPRSDDFEGAFKDHQEHKDASKKRKMMPKWTDQVRVSSESGLEGPHDDGYSWRKYGQKDILGAKYPRSYYRCTYRNTQNCWATKQVQRSDEDPSIFEITYRGKHSCSNGNQTNIPAPASPEKQEQKQNNHQHQSQDNFRANLRVNTEDLNNKEMPSFSFPSTSFGINQELDNSNFLGDYSPSFISPATPESNYFPLSPCQISSLGGMCNVQRSESELTDIISANNSVTNSPILDLDFSLVPVELDQNPFDTPGFFTSFH